MATAFSYWRKTKIYTVIRHYCKYTIIIYFSICSEIFILFLGCKLQGALFIEFGGV